MKKSLWKLLLATLIFLLLLTSCDKYVTCFHEDADSDLICDKCGVSLGEDHEHVESDWIIYSVATCTEGGYRCTKCTRCGYRLVEIETHPTGHDYQIIETVDATCTSDGKTVSVCQNEGCTDVVEQVIPATGHDFGEWSLVNSSETYNTYVRTCKTCGSQEYLDEPIAPETHKWDQTYEILFHTLYIGSAVAVCHCSECDYTVEITLPNIYEPASYHSYTPGNCLDTNDSYSHTVYNETYQDFFGNCYIFFSFKVEAPYEHDAAPAKEDCIPTEGEYAIYYAYFCTKCDSYIVAYSEPKQPTVNTSYLSFAQIDGGLMVTGLIDKSVTDVVIPASYQGKDVIAIGDHAFFESNIQTISIPYTVTDIGYWALYCCTSLYSITVDDSNPVYRSYNGDLYNEDYSELIQYAVGKTDTSYTVFDRVKKIAESAFAYGLNLKSVRIADNVKEIGSGAFFLCYNITDVVIPARLTDFDGVAFTSCISLAKVFYGGSEKNWNTNSLASMFDQSSKPTIYFYSETRPTEEGNFWHYVDGVPTVWDAYGEPETPEFSEGLIFTISDDGSYYTLDGIGNCTDTEIYIPPTYNGLPVKAIGDSAFKDCTQITKVVIPEGVTRIGTIGTGMAMSFRGCTNLETVIIPDSMSYIGATAGESAFYNCNKLWTYENGVYYINNWAITGHYWGITSTSYPETTPSLLIIRDGTVGIGNQAFIFGEYTEVIIPSSLKYVCQVAFMNWYSVERIYYAGTPELWSAIQIDLYNDGLTDHPVYFYSETKPTEEGNFWHYANGVPTVWDAYVEPEVSGELAYTLSNDGTYYIVEGIGTYTGTEIVILNEYKGIPVKVIKEKAFYYNDAITSITIPENITNIGGEAFAGCGSVTTLHFNAICCGDLGNGGHSGDFSFGGIGYNSNGTTVYIGEKVTRIPDHIFGYFMSWVPEQNKITDVIFAPNSVCEYIGMYAFESCKYLKNINVPNSIEYVGYGAFNSCDELLYNQYSNALYLGDDNNPYVLLIKTENTYISECVVHENTKVIHSYAFRDCPALTSVVISDSIKQIGADVFSNCNKLMFSEYDNALYIGNESNPYIALIKAKNTSITSCISHPSTKVVAGGAFTLCNDLTSVTISTSVSNISAYTFYGCSSLKNLSIPNSVKYIGYGAFMGCSSLTEIDLPDNLIQIGACSFHGCQTLQSISIPKNTKIISGQAFDCCYSLKNITIPNNVFFIGKFAFYRCTGLTSVVIGDSVTSIGSWAFSGCDNLQDVYYTGSEAEWNTIVIGSNNPIIYCEKHYNYAP